MEIKKILCPVDFSESLELAVKYAASLASLFGAKLHLLHVVEHLHGHEHFLILALTSQEIAEKMKTQAQEQLSRFTSQLDEGSGIEAEVREGKAFVEIIKMAREESIDLIVMGSHGRTGLPHILIGSVAERVIRKAPCPVLIVKTKGRKLNDT